MSEDLTIREKTAIENMRTVGYWSTLGGVELKHIEHGIEDYLYCVSGAWTGNHSYHRLRVYTSHAKDSRMYVKLQGYKLYLDECIRN